MKRYYKITALLIASVMAISMLPSTVAADETEGSTPYIETFDVSDIDTESDVDEINTGSVSIEEEYYNESTQEETNIDDYEISQHADTNVQTAESVLLNADNTSNNEVLYSGVCGDNLTWVLDDEGTLTISGTGDMYDYRIGGYRGRYSLGDPVP